MRENFGRGPITSKNFWAICKRRKRRSPQTEIRWPCGWLAMSKPSFISCTQSQASAMNRLCATSASAMASPIPELAPVTRMFFMRLGPFQQIQSDAAVLSVNQNRVLPPQLERVRCALSVFVFAMDMVMPPLNTENGKENCSAGNLSDNSTKESAAN